MTTRDDALRLEPDAPLDHRLASRGKLRIFFGASRKVGKTHAMLASAQRAKREGVDVVAGVVESRGQQELCALLEGLPSVPHQGATHGPARSELDLDAALARRPAVLLLDELAHTNAPGSRHAKRWQDVLELLSVGIEVHTTLNVENVESLNDVIVQITHVRVLETVPDAMLERADYIELVDAPAEVVAARLHAGDALGSEEHAGFAREGTLHALRELALRTLAERVDADVQAWRRKQGIEATWPARERLMVCVGPAPQSADLVRAARRMAGAVHAPWIAAYVERPGARPLSNEDGERLAGHLRLAESLGAESVVLSGARPAERLLALAHQRNVTRIVVGKPTHPRWRDVVYGSLLDDLIRGSGDIDVHVITGEHTDAPPPPTERPDPPLDPWEFVRGAVPVVVATGLAALLRGAVGMADIAMIFLAAIAASATFAGRWPAIFASILAVALFAILFVPPFGTLAVSDLRFTITFAVMLLAGMLISSLTARIRRQSSAARDREERTAALYALTRALAGARDATEIAKIATAQIESVFDSSAVLLLPEHDQPMGLRAASGGGLSLDDADRAVARWAFDHARPAGRGLDTLPGSRVMAFPLAVDGVAVGVLAIVPNARLRDPAQRHLLETFVAQITLAFDRSRLAEEARQAELRATAEELRSSLLSSVSHDLRTPLGAVLGAATTLLDGGAALEPAVRAELASTVRDEASRLARLVSNLLDMTRVESGALKVGREWVPVEELVGAVMTRLEPQLAGRDVRIVVPRELSVHVDPVLFEQVLWNLLENAVKHTPDGTAIGIVASGGERDVVIEVGDSGKGIPARILPRIFEKFVRGRSGEGGVGLGLAIVRGIVQAHGGTISATSREGGGAVFRVTMPVEGTPPHVPDEADERDQEEGGEA